MTSRFSAITRFGFLVGLLCSLVSSTYAAKLPGALPARTADVAMQEGSKSVKFDFQQVSVAQVIGLVYSDALKQPYVIDPAVLRDDRLVSFRFDASQGDLRVFLRNFMDALGFVIEARNGVDFVMAKPPAQKESGAKEGKEVFIYHPQYRSLSYLADILTPLFSSGGFTTSRAVHASAEAKIDTGSTTVSPTSASALIDQDADTLVFQGLLDEVTKLKKLLPLVDTPYGEVVVKAIVYEVNTGTTEGSAFSLALNLLGSKLGISMGGDATTSGNAVTLKTGSIDLAFSALAGDSRFKVVSTPHVRVKSGIQARLTVGQEVPTLGAVTYSQGSGQAVQSVEYRSSGVLLSLTPVVRGATVDVAVDQQISDFARTETGVNSSPTLTKRALSSTVSVKDSELVVMGGLVQDKNANSSTGLSFLPKFLHTKNDTNSRTEILLLLQVSRVKADELAAQ